MALLPLLLLLLVTLVSGLSRSKSRGSNTPDRNEIYDLLAEDGCTNKLIASYVIEASLSGVSAKYLTIRIGNISGYTITESTLTKWINVVTSYYD